MFTLNCKGRLLIVEQPVVMGIINVTPDSFYTDSRVESDERLLQTAEKMLTDGAAILDIGGQSTRPGSGMVSEEEESERVIPAIEKITKRFPEAIISIDTFYSRVAQKAVDAGATIINDISGGMIDEEMIPVTGRLEVPYICMHMKGTPQTMHRFTDYNDLITEIVDYFIEKIRICHEAGIKDIIIDPGIGFSKTIPQNFEVLKKLNVLQILGKPVLIGISRKGTIYKTLGISAEEALNGTTVLNTISLLNGASILRVHDVKEAVEAVKLVKNVEI